MRNTGKVVAQMAGWQVRDASGRSLTLPHYSLKPGNTVRVFTGMEWKAAGRLYLGSPSNVWRAHGIDRLDDRSGTKIASLRY